TQHRAAEHEALARVSAKLRAVSEHEEITSVVLDEVSTLLHCEGALLMIVDPGTGEIVNQQGRGLLAGYSNMRTPQGTGLTWKVIESGLPFSTDHLEGYPDVAGKVPFIPCAACCLPMFIGHLPEGGNLAASGAVWVGRKLPSQQTELHLLNALVDMVASALNRSDLLQRTLQNARNLETVNQLGHDLAETHDLSTIYQRLGEAVSELIGDISSVLISLFEATSEKITCVYAQNDGALIDVSQLPPLTLAPNGEGTQSQVVRTKQPLIVDHLGDRLRVKKIRLGDEKDAQSALYVPMLAKGQVMGIIQVQSFKLFAFGAEDVELLTLIGNTAAVAIENARLISATQTQLAHLEALHAIDEAINSSLDLQLILIILLNQVKAQLNIDAAGILLYQQGSQMLEYAAGEGFRSSGYKRSRVRHGAEMAGVVMRDRKKMILSMPGPRFFLRSGNLASEGFNFYACFPLIAKGQAMGVLEVFHRTEFEPDAQWISFLDALASQAAIAVGNSGLFEDLMRSHFELAEAYDSTLTGWMRTLELRDDETEQHTGRVIDITLTLAHAIGMAKSEIEHVRRGALLHDIGKMGIPDNVLHKKGTLTPIEWEIMRTHPVLAYQLLSPIA
ncbi:MAG: GAF domain-containing protein, partial [Anaerolineaceae bacterium]|nr:GAF domain-containing protein [Anaerolineaceae bacterium]